MRILVESLCIARPQTGSSLTLQREDLPVEGLPIEYVEDFLESDFPGWKKVSELDYVEGVQ